MALVLKYLHNEYSYYFNTFSDPRIENLPLLASPVPVIIILATYLYFILKLGPKWMEDRKPYNLTNVIKWYNAIQVISNLMLAIHALKNSYLRKEFSMLCQPVDQSNNEPYMKNLILATYGYYMLKYLDLLDTIFFVLRKKNNQITFLHVYHHAGMVVAVYTFTKFLIGSHSTMLGIINGFVHVFMYSYYLLTSINDDFKKNAWWKKHITQIQLLQFGYLIIHFSIPLINNSCNHPRGIALIGLIQNVFMFILFLDFYLKAYCNIESRKNNNNNKYIKKINGNNLSIPVQNHKKIT